MIRFYGHFEGDAQTYRAAGEVEELRANRDCLTRFAQQVAQAGVLEQADLDSVDREVAALIDEGVAEAQQAPHPSEDQVLTDVYVSY